MEVEFAADTPGPAAVAFDVVADLGSYPEWLDLVQRVEPAEAAAGDDGPAYWVTLRARVGPLARSKRLRMVRTGHRPGERVVFQRREVDGRTHSPWELTALVADGGGTSEVRVTLHYGGRLWAEPLSGVLTSQVERAVPRLQAMVRARS